MTIKETVLIVDDEREIRRLVNQKLSSLGYRCLEAGNGEQALDNLNDEVGLVLLDIKMPGKSGVELLPEIKARNPSAAVIMVTATADVSTAIHCMRRGAYD